MDDRRSNLSRESTLKKGPPLRQLNEIGLRLRGRVRKLGPAAIKQRSNARTGLGGDIMVRVRRRFRYAILGRGGAYAYKMKPQDNNGMKASTIHRKIGGPMYKVRGACYHGRWR